MKFAKRKNMTLLFLLFMSMILMGIGYASIQSVTGEITGKASSKMQDGVFITNVEYVSDVDANKDSSKIELYSGTMMKSTVKLSSTNINSQIKYKVTVYNNSEERQPFTGVRHGDEYYDNNDIIFEVNGFKPGQTIEPKETKDIIITFKYKNNIPENTVLSHDLLEGCYLRCGLVSDIMLMDGYPTKYNSFMNRLSRWIRGDWQIVRWMNSKSPLNLLSKYKIFDNLRRSLLEVSIIISIIYLNIIGIFYSKNIYGIVTFLLLISVCPFILEILNEKESKNKRLLLQKYQE